jgi:hypothetical protein
MLNGVIAPWYHGLNGQVDERLNIAVNVYKRYPWVDKPKAVMAAPDFIYNSHWSIKPDGTILIPPTTDWMCGDLAQRTWSTIKGTHGLLPIQRRSDRVRLYPAGGGLHFGLWIN